MKYTSQHCCDKTIGRQNALSRMLFSELYKMMVKKVASVGFMGGDRPPLGSAVASWDRRKSVVIA